jgi:hypothetical protein
MSLTVVSHGLMKTIWTWRHVQFSIDQLKTRSAGWQRFIVGTGQLAKRNLAAH